MKAFIQIATPHQDIIDGKLTMDVFAADLWQVVQGKAPAEYRDPDLFFRRTYETEGLRNIINTAKSRLEGKSGDSIIQLQTPFGGGKTHTLIALYHKAKEWGANVVVIDGTALDPKEKRLWEELERQLMGNVILMKGDTAPGKEKLIYLLSEKSPVLILVDELLEYITKASGVKVGDSNLAAQSFAFIQELTGAVSVVGNALLVLTLPSSTLEHYDENAEKYFQQLQHVTGRVEKVYTPVKDDEIELVVRKRLFDKIDEDWAKKIVDDFVEHARREGLLSGDALVRYREDFLKSYPFKPEVIEVLYKRWGSFPNFQRTRGVLRMLSLVVHKLLDKKIPFIRLGDFDLGDEELRREIVKYIGTDWDSVIAQDIVGKDSGAKKVDEEIEPSYKPYNLGTVVSTYIFLTSHSGKGEMEGGVTINDIKIGSITPEFPSSIIDTVIIKLKDRLFYLADEGYYFTKQANLNRILVLEEANVTQEEIQEKEEAIWEKHLKDTVLKVYKYPKFPQDIPDTPDLKLVILKEGKPSRDFLERRGESPRIYVNTLIFLCPKEDNKGEFYDYLRKLVAHEKARHRNLSDIQKEELERKLRDLEKLSYEKLRKYFSKLFIPEKDGFKELDLGIPSYGQTNLTQEIYDYLKSKEEILERLSPKIIKEKYLGEKDLLQIARLYEAFLKTPGELRLKSKEVFIESIKSGVKEGFFGFGYLDGNVPKCLHIKEEVNVELTENEIITKPELCVKEEIGTAEGPTAPKVVESYPFEVKENPKTYTESYPGVKVYRRLSLTLKVPRGKLSDISKMLNMLYEKFSCSVEMKIQATDGEITASDYEDKILETLKQAGIEIISEDKE